MVLVAMVIVMIAVVIVMVVMFIVMVAMVTVISPAVTCTHVNCWTATSPGHSTWSWRTADSA